MYNVNIFIRKKSLSNHHSIERFANTLKEIKYKKKIKINILKCPVSSKGFLRRLYLVFWSYFNQGDINHILGDINFISIFSVFDQDPLCGFDKAFHPIFFTSSVCFSGSHLKKCP